MTFLIYGFWAPVWGAHTAQLRLAIKTKKGQRTRHKYCNSFYIYEDLHTYSTYMCTVHHRLILVRQVSLCSDSKITYCNCSQVSKLFDPVIYMKERYSQRRQSAKLFLQPSELGLPQPLSHRRVCPPPFDPGGGGKGTLTCGSGVGGVPIRWGDIHCGALFMYISTLWRYCTGAAGKPFKN